MFTLHISELINDGFNCIPVLDNLKEIGITENVYLVGNTMIDTQKKYLQQALNTKYNDAVSTHESGYYMVDYSQLPL